jgi:hypothetical protein
MAKYILSFIALTLFAGAIASMGTQSSAQDQARQPMPTPLPTMSAIPTIPPMPIPSVTAMPSPSATPT